MMSNFFFTIRKVIIYLSLGVSYFTRHLISSLAALLKSWSFFVYFDSFLPLQNNSGDDKPVNYLCKIADMFFFFVFLLKLL